MKKQNFNEASSLELVKVNGSRFAAEVLNGNARINLTQMAKPFGESCKPSKWLRTDEAKRYLNAIAVGQKCPTADLLEVRQGGDPLEQGTWCRDYRIALRFAQWLSPEFSIKVDEAILNLLTGRRVTPGDNGPTGASAPAAGCGRSALGRLPIPRERSAALGEFYSELRKWVLKEDEAAVAELAGVSRGHVAEVLAGRKAGYGVLCLLVEYATENRAAGRQRMVRSAARRAEQVEELRLDFMARLVPETNGMSASADMRQTNPLRTGASAELRRDESVMRRDESRLYKGGGSLPETNGATGASPQVTGDAMNRVSTAKAQDVTDGVIDFNGMEG